MRTRSLLGKPLLLLLTPGLEARDSFERSRRLACFPGDRPDCKEDTPGGGMLYLRTFGTLTLQGEDGEPLAPILSQPKRLALLAFLAAAPEGDLYRRDTLLGLFWPEMDETHARNALSQSLSYLRRHLPEGLILSRGPDEVGVAPEALRVDLHEFQAAVKHGRWFQALDLYRGEFLRGFHLDGAPGFEDWMAGEGERLREAAAGAAWSLAREQIQRGALVEAERTAQWALGQVWTDETPVREFVRALAKAGDQASALNFYERFCSRLREELELEPSPATVQIAQAIRNGEIETGEAPPEATSPMEELPIGVGETPPDHPAQDESVSASPIPSMEKTRRRVGWGGLWVAALALAVLGYLGLRVERESGGSPSVERQLTFKGNVELSSLSRDGEYLAYTVGTSPRKLLVQDLGNGAELMIADSLGRVYDLRWSPDGSWLGFAGEYRNRVGLFLFPRLGGLPRTAPYFGPHFAWSPDSRRLATWFLGTRVVQIQDLESGRADSVSLSGQGESFIWGGDWAPRGDLLALTTGTDGGPSQIILLDLAAGTQEALLTDSLNLRSPRWSSTGDALFFLRDGYLQEGELWTIDVDPSGARDGGPGRRIRDLPGVTRWTNSLGSYFALSFDLSGDGRMLSYTTAFAHTNLSVIPPGDGGLSEPVTLTSGTAQRRCPRLSPDGSSLAFLQETPEGWDLFRVPVQGGVPVRLTFSGTVVSDCASWDPESQRLAVGMGVDGTHKVAVVPAPGGTPRVCDHCEMSMELAWAPGSHIAYQTPGNRNFRILDPETASDTRLIRDPSDRGWMFDPRFSPNGTLLAVYWARGGSSGVWVISPADGSRRQISALREFPIGWSVDGQSLLTADPEGVVRRYSLDGGEATIIPQPPEGGEALCQPHERGNGVFWVCKAEHSFSDVWMVENPIGIEP